MKSALNRLKIMRQAAGILKKSALKQRNEVLEILADLLETQSKSLLIANQKDISRLTSKVSEAFCERLQLSEERIAQMSQGIRELIEMPDPLAEVLHETWLSNGLYLRQVREPLGTIFLIFESRPNVVVEAFSLSVKSGNALILKGGRESLASAQFLFSLIQKALKKVGLPQEVFWGVFDPKREKTMFLLKQNQFIDVVIPRGGENLIKAVKKNSSIPIIKNDWGMCHVYVHEDAELSMAAQIVVNSKTQRPGVCNALETLLVHENLAPRLLPLLYEELTELRRVQWWGCSKTLKILKNQTGVRLAKPSNWDSEYLALQINCRVVSSLDEAIDHISKHGSHHSECIVTSSEECAQKFQTQISAAVVYWNASTRFTDGQQMGLGGEVGISTQKLHVWGPVGLRALTCLKWLVDGTGQVRT